MLLDMKTVMVLIVFGHIFSVILISAYWRTHMKDHLLSMFLIAKATQVLAWLVIVMRNGIPDLLTISLTNSLLFIGFSLETAAMLKLQQRFSRSIPMVYLTLTILVIAAFHIVLFTSNQENVRIAVASIGIALFMAVPAYLLIRSKNPSFIKRTIGFLYVSILVSLLGRSFIALGTHEMIGMFTPSIYQTFTFLSLFLIMFIGNIGFVLLLKEQADQELERLANYDDLTGVLNRRTFISFSMRMIAEHARRGEHLSLVLFDIDHFKKINDTYGHAIGDRALQQLSAHIGSLLRSKDCFSRYGGDEFAILLPETDEYEADQLVEALRQSTMQVLVPEMASRLSISLGVVTVLPTEQTKLESLYKLCDKALYTAKDNGRNVAARMEMAAMIG
ncbi:GGDEF domain-containing protein [Paenibacillus sp. 2TAB23]|uniref:GGDEF domain-containing protein n=1 Tax=Paenibacillus sp. 2TAB23 TaxID=3233004 RepID=UPI003F9BFA8D